MTSRERGDGRPAIAIAATALTIFAVAALVLVIQGMGAFQEREESPPPPGDITTTVRADRLVDTVSADARVIAGATWALEADGIVTRAGVRAGAAISSGDLVAVLDERPVFAMAGTIPTYRDLGPGAVGDDVKQLQISLAALGYYDYDADGKYEKGTARAVYDFYVDREFRPLNVSGRPVDFTQRETAGVPASELTFAPGGAAVAVSSCGTVAQRVAGPLCELQSGDAITVISVEGTEADRVKTGQSVEVTLGSEKVLGTIGSRFDTRGSGRAQSAEGADGAASEDGTGAASKGESVQFVIEHDQQITGTAGTAGGASIVVESSAEGSLVVDAVAIREDDEGRLWLQRADGHARIDVTTVLCLRGACVVEGEGVVDGLEVIVLIPGRSSEDGSGPS